MNRLFFGKNSRLEEVTQNYLICLTAATKADKDAQHTKGKVAMHITVKRFSAHSLGDTVSYLVSVD